MAQQVTAASAAAATQPTPAAGASEGLGSQVKNLAFPPFLYLQDTCLCPGLVYIPSPGSMSRCFSKNFWEFSGVFTPKVAREFTGRARCVLTKMENKNGRNLSFFTGVSEFGSWARCASWLQEIPAAGDWELFWEFSGVFKEFRGVWIRQLRTGRRAPGRESYPQAIHMLFILGSLGV